MYSRKQSKTTKDIVIEDLQRKAPFLAEYMKFSNGMTNLIEKIYKDDNHDSIKLGLEQVPSPKANFALSLYENDDDDIYVSSLSESVKLNKMKVKENYDVYNGIGLEGHKLNYMRTYLKIQYNKEGLRNIQTVELLVSRFQENKDIMEDLDDIFIDVEDYLEQEEDEDSDKENDREETYENTRDKYPITESAVRVHFGDIDRYFAYIVDKIDNNVTLRKNVGNLGNGDFKEKTEEIISNSNPNKIYQENLTSELYDSLIVYYDKIKEGEVDINDTVLNHKKS